MDSLTQTFYARNAGRLAGEYDKAKGSIEPRLLRAFANSQRILDIGCGTGRDLASLLQSGKDAVGADPVPEMLAAAADTLRRNGINADGRLFATGLPELGGFANNDFDGVLCSAVFMHLPDEQVFDAVYSLRRVLRSGGTLLMSIPQKRPGIDPATQRDSAGRLFADWPAAKLQLLFERVGFVIRESDVVADSLGRLGHDWLMLEMRLEEGEMSISALPFEGKNDNDSVVKGRAPL